MSWIAPKKHLGVSKGCSSAVLKQNPTSLFFNQPPLMEQILSIPDRTGRAMGNLRDLDVPLPFSLCKGVVSGRNWHFLFQVCWTDLHKTRHILRSRQQQKVMSMIVHQYPLRLVLMSFQAWADAPCQWDLVAQPNASQVLSTKCFGQNEDKTLFTNIVKTSQYEWSAMDSHEKFEPPDFSSTALWGFVSQREYQWKNLFQYFVIFYKKERFSGAAADLRRNPRLANHQQLQAPKYCICGWKMRKYLSFLSGNT